MGFFDKLAGKTQATPSGDGASPPVDAPVSAVAPRLIAAREKLEAQDLAGAVAIYDEVLASAGDRADVLVTISGDLGSTGHIPQIIELIAPRYDALRHGPATGINLVQAYLAVRDPDAAQHVLDILFSLKKPELEGRLHGFSNAIAELIQSGNLEGIPQANPVGQAENVGVALVTISRPIWSYGFETVEGLLPRKTGKLRRVAFAQFALPTGYENPEEASQRPADELGKLSRAIPLWFAETFYFSPAYGSVAALGVLNGAPKRPALFVQDWTIENLNKMAESATEGLDYIFTGNLRKEAEEYILIMRVWEVRKMRERKQFTIKWTAATADAELARLHDYVRKFMEWTAYPEGEGLPYSPPASPLIWADTTAALLGLFLVEKGLMPKDLLPPLAPVFDGLAPHAFTPPSASLAWTALRMKAAAAGLAPTLSDVLLSRHPAVAQARTIAGF
ncbi:MAG TPA: hypothetical protein VGG34_03855 [Opitutaceae bacterium]|jgi:hypothetical protein